MTLGYPRSGTVLGFKGQGHRVNKFVFHTNVWRINSNANDPKVFNLGVGNDLGISYNLYGFGLKGQMLGLGLTLISRT